MQKQHCGATPGAVQLDGDTPHLELGQFRRHVIRSLPKNTPSKRALLLLSLLIVLVTRVFAGIEARRQPAKPPPML